MSRKLLALIFLIPLYGCLNYPVYNTEIFCPGEPPMLIKFATARDLRNAAIKDYYDKLQKNENPSKTVFKLPDDRSFAIKIPPQIMINCRFVQSHYGQVDNNYVHYF